MGLLPCNSESVLLAALLLLCFALLCFALLCFVLLCLLSFAFLCFAYVAVLARLRLLSFALLALLASPAFAQRFQTPAAWGLRRHRKNGKHPQHNRDVSKTSPKRQQRAKREKNEGCHPLILAEPRPERKEEGGRHPILSINIFCKGFHFLKIIGCHPFPFCVLAWILRRFGGGTLCFSRA